MAPIKKRVRDSPAAAVGSDRPVRRKLAFHTTKPLISSDTLIGQDDEATSSLTEPKPEPEASPEPEAAPHAPSQACGSAGACCSTTTTPTAQQPQPAITAAACEPAAADAPKASASHGPLQGPEE